MLQYERVYFCFVNSGIEFAVTGRMVTFTDQIPWLEKS